MQLRPLGSEFSCFVSKIRPVNIWIQILKYRYFGRSSAADWNHDSDSDAPMAAIKHYDGRRVGYPARTAAAGACVATGRAPRPSDGPKAPWPAGEQSGGGAGPGLRMPSRLSGRYPP